MIAAACIDCGKVRQFTGPSQITTRCRPCSTRNGWATGAYANNRRVPPRPCKACGAMFTPPPGQTNRLTCSQECKFALRGRITKQHIANGVIKPMPQQRVTLLCKACGKEFKVQQYRAEQAIVCSRECGSELRRRVTGENHPLFVPKQRMACEICGTVCDVKPSLVSRFRFCSRSCTGVWVASHQPRVSSLEERVAAVMDGLGIVYQQQVRIGRFVADFVVGRTAIEVDGVYWHSLPKVVARDVRKNAAYRAAGYDVIRIPEADVRSGSLDALLALV